MNEQGNDEMEEFGAEGMDWSESADLTSLNPSELRDLLVRLSEEERVVSYRRRLFQGRIDLIRSELVSRGKISRSPEELARVLLGEESGFHTGDTSEKGDL